MAFKKEETFRSIKNYICDKCGGPIPKGTEYVRLTNTVTKKVIQTMHHHIKCHNNL